MLFQFYRVEVRIYLHLDYKSDLFSFSESNRSSQCAFNETTWCLFASIRFSCVASHQLPPLFLSSSLLFSVFLPLLWFALALRTRLKIKQKQLRNPVRGQRRRCRDPLDQSLRQTQIRYQRIRPSNRRRRETPPKDHKSPIQPVLSRP